MDGKIKQELIKNDEWEIMTPDGWSDFDGLLVTYNRELIEIEIDNKTLKCTPEHKIFINDIDYMEAKTIKHKKIEGSHTVYDPINVVNKNRYLSNGILSHNCVILDEFAFLPRTVADEFFTSIYPTISSGETTKMIVISTPKGLNHFYKMYTDSVNHQNDYKNLEIKWNDVPGRDEKFKEEQIKNFGPDRWRQEFESEFIGSASTLISPRALTNMVAQPILNEIIGIKIFEKPLPERKYFITMDPSEGKGLDYHAFIVVDITERPFRVAATWRNKVMDPLLVPDVLYHAGKMYNDAFILIETKSTGTQISDGLFYTKEYLNLLGAKNSGRSGQIMTNYKKDAKGLSTSTTTKSVGCSNLRMIVENEQLIVNDFDIIEEFSHFSLNGNTYKADDGYHDDLIMCLVIFAWASTQKYFQNLSTINIEEILAEKQKSIQETFLPIFASDGFIGSEKEIDNNDFNEEEWERIEPNQNWL